MSDFQKACLIDDIDAGTGVCALISNKQVALFRPTKEAKVFAIDNFDPIGKANVLSRGLIADIKQTLTVASPLYKQHYDLETGQCLEDDSLKVPVYEVKVKNGEVWVKA